MEMEDSGPLVARGYPAGMSLDVAAAAYDLFMGRDSIHLSAEPFEHGVGPAGACAAELDPGTRARLRDQARAMLPPDRFTIIARAWAARGVVAPLP